MTFTFAKHETFYIREGWLRKGLIAIQQNPHIFLEDDIAMDELGIGKNMISSLRYWMQAVYLSKEGYYGNGYKEQEMTQFAETVLDFDPYLEDTSTYWLLHYYLVTNTLDSNGKEALQNEISSRHSSETATTWYWFFNEFHYPKFSKELFIAELTQFIKRSGEKVPAESSLEKDFSTFINTYLYRPEDNDKTPEDLIRSPFSDLQLIRVNSSQYVIDKNEEYIINRPTPETLDYRILYYCLKEWAEDSDSEQISVEQALSASKNIGRVFKLDLNTLYKYLDLLQENNYIRLDRAAGLNVITLLNSQDCCGLLADYYESKYTRERD